MSYGYALFNNQGSFPAIMATDDRTVNMSKSVTVDSDLREIGILKGIEPENIKAIMVLE